MLSIQKSSVSAMDSQNNQTYIGDMISAKYPKYDRRHGFGENVDCGNREEIKSSCVGF